MTCRVTLLESEEGWSVSCPSLPGCHSQGTTREEAIENIKEAIQLWLEVEAGEDGIKRVEDGPVTVSPHSRIQVLSNQRAGFLCGH